MNVYVNLYRLLVHAGIWALYYFLSYNYYVNWLSDRSLYALPLLIHLYTFLHIFLMVIPIYLNYFYLFSTYFLYKKYLSYIIGLIGAIGLTDMLMVELDVLAIPKGQIPQLRTLGHYFVYIPYTMVFLIMFSWGKLIEGWYEKNREIEMMNKAKLDAELRWLKAQIHPHFFFNALNNIRALVRFRSDDAEEMLLRLSDLMRYVMAHHGNSQIGLQQEVEHIQNYIDLACMKSRWKGKIRFDKPDPIPNIDIEPLILTNFVENALKHGNLDDSEGFVQISLVANEESIRFTVENSKDEARSSSPVSGIGMENVQRRLDLVYPSRYHLNILPANNRYIVDLLIQL